LLLTAKKLWTWLLLLFESLSKALWKPVCWALFFFGLWLLPLPLLTGGWSSFVLAVLFYAGLFYWLWQASLTLPNSAQVERRLERDSGLKHRPLSKDTPAEELAGESQSLWQRNQEALRRSLQNLHWSTPHPILADCDPYALRMLALLIFVIGLWSAGPGWSYSLYRGAFPFMAGGETEPDPQKLTTIWVSPPEYTGLPQMKLQARGKQDTAIEIPAYSTIKSSVFGGLMAPTLHIEGPQGEQEWAYKKAEGDLYINEFALPEEYATDESYHLSIRQHFLTELAQDFTITPDIPPNLSTASEPKVLSDGSIRFFIDAIDDYGLEKLTLHMQIDPIVEDKPIGQPYSETRTLLTPGGEMTELRPSYNLTHHSWAGLPVMFSFEAMDARGQVAYLGPVFMQLPEKQFRHPIAKKLIAHRKELIWEPKGRHEDMAQELEKILMRPDLFQFDLVAGLALRSAASRLYYTPDYPQVQEDNARTLIPLLWDTALRIEEGNVSIAERELKRAQQNLMEALGDPETSTQEKQFLMEQLKQALARYMQELQKEFQKRFSEMAQQQGAELMPPENMAENMLNTDMFAEMMRKLEQSMMKGEAADAQEMLSQMVEMMKMFNPSNIREMPEDMKMMQKGVNELQELIDRQQDLLDQTVRQDAELQEQIQKQLQKFLKGNQDQAPKPSIDTQKNQIEQEALRYALGQLMREAGEKIDQVPESMGKAELEMRGSAKQLGANNPTQSIPHQQKALEHLKDSQQSLSQQLQKRMQNMVIMSMGARPSGGLPYAPGRYDPLGRPYDPNGDQGEDAPRSDVEVPDAMERRRVQEIQKILRERSGDYERPEAEREYYHRLLDQF